MSKINIVLDASMVDMFRLCECRFNYRYNLNLVLPEKSSPLSRGTLVHIGNEFYYQALKDGLSYESAVDIALMKIKSAGVIEDVDEAIIERVVDVMEEYYDYWRFSDQQFQIVEVERPFLYLLHEDDDMRIHLSGKIDLIISDNRYTNLPYDHKSYDRSHEVGRMSNQFKNYCYAMESNYLIVNKIGFQKTLKPHEKFVRVPLSYDHILLAEWKDNIIKVVRHYVTCVAEKSWPMNETSCDKFNRKCEYYDVCDSSGSDAKNFKLNNNYISTEPWDVTKALLKSSEALELKEKKDNVTSKG